jgi:hypothetical protein
MPRFWGGVKFIFFYKLCVCKSKQRGLLCSFFVLFCFEIVTRVSRGKQSWSLQERNRCLDSMMLCSILIYVSSLVTNVQFSQCRLCKQTSNSAFAYRFRCRHDKKEKFRERQAKASAPQNEDEPSPIAKFYFLRKVLIDAAVHSEHELVIRCDIGPRSAERSRDD